MPEESQDVFMARVREALVDRGQPVELPESLETARVIGLDQDPVEVFATRVDESGMRAYRASDEQAMLDRIVDIITGGGGKSAVVPEEGDLPARDRIIARLKESGIELLSPDEPDASFEADFGITAVVAAIAETASMCVVSGGGRRRLASLAVPSHIAIVRKEQIVRDLKGVLSIATPIFDAVADEALHVELAGPEEAEVELRDLRRASEHDDAGSGRRVSKALR